MSFQLFLYKDTCFTRILSKDVAGRLISSAFNEIMSDVNRWKDEANSTNTTNAF